MSDRSKKPGSSLVALALDECRALHAALLHRQDVGESIHEARKAIRRLRSLFALANERVDGLVNLDRSMERLGEGLSTLRDAHVAIPTARKLALTDSTAPWPALVEALERRRDTLLAQDLARSPGFQSRRRFATRVEKALQQLDWAPLRAKDVRVALERSQKRAKQAGKRASETPNPENIHRWRRRTRRLRMQLEAARKPWPDIATGVARPSLRKQLKSLRELSDELGWYQDLQVLRGLVGRMKHAPERALLLQHLRASIGRTHAGRN